MKSVTKALAVLLAAAALVPLAQARVHDHIYGSTFEVITDLPANAHEASRFLTQATFGPTQTDISHVMQVGYGEWIEQQLGLNPTLGESTVESVVNLRAADTVNKPGNSQTQRLNRWFWQATYAPDQLRQRMAFALSQIFVVSDQNSTLSNDIVQLASYQDLLASDAFVSYRTLLGDVTYNPVMGIFLSSFHNQKANCSAPNVCSTNADENYAREVMQLFSVGLIVVDKDNSPLGGMIVPTYDQTVITHTAKVFTGFTYSDAPTTGSINFFGGGATFATQDAPMACWGREIFGDGNSNVRHDQTGDDGTQQTNKSVLGNGMISPDQDCSKDVSDELDIINEHPNVAPFISRQLIERFVTSNPSQGVDPSPGYIARVANVFENSGGDLGDVIKAILLDDEARNPPTLPAVTPSSCTAGECDSYGKLREPLLRLTAMWRAFNAVAPAPDTKYHEISMTAGTNFLSSFGQGPLESPTVFNFYPPDYQQPGTFADDNLFSPEFAIINEATTYSLGNSFYKFTAQAFQTGLTDRPTLNLSSLTANVNNSAALVQTINDNMLYGSMSTLMQGHLANMVDNLVGGGATANEVAWSAIYVTMLSPEYATQR